MFAVTLRRFYDAGRKRISAVILIVTSILVDIGFDISQINGIAITLNIISVICTLILIVITLLPSRHVADEQLKWL
jgi:Mn2+/Fe2+ NRAMP family transporter